MSRIIRTRDRKGWNIERTLDDVVEVKQEKPAKKPKKKQEQTGE